MAMVLTQFRFFFPFSFGWVGNTQHRTRAPFPTLSQLVTNQSPLTVQWWWHMLSSGQIWLGCIFQQCFISGVEVSLRWGLSAHDCTTVINQTWQQWLHLYKYETGRFHNQNHPISIRVSSLVMSFHLFLFSPIFN